MNKLPAMEPSAIVFSTSWLKVLLVLLARELELQAEPRAWLVNISFILSSL